MNGLKDVVGIISFKKKNPNLLMHEIIFLIHTFDFQVALSMLLPISLYCCEIWGLESALKCKESDPY
jgi:hypothetical protein